MRKCLVGLWALAGLAADGSGRGSHRNSSNWRAQRAPPLDAPIMWVPTAGERDAYDAAELAKSFRSPDLVQEIPPVDGNGMILEMDLHHGQRPG